MRKDIIKENIDKKIIKELINNKTPEEVRLVLMDFINKFSEQVKNKENITSENDIDSLEDARSKHLLYYIFYAKNRIIVLYKIENIKSEWDYLKKFKSQLFKERLLKNIKYT